MPDDIRRQARDVTGVTGWMYSRGWDELARVNPDYLRSFESTRVPPSLHISARDRRRAGQPIPLAERCIEDFRTPSSERPGPWSTAELSASHRGVRRGRRTGGRRRPTADPND